MKKFLFLAAFGLFTSLFWTSCEKERLSSSTDEGFSAGSVDFREADYSEEEIADIEATIEEITGFKTRIDGWRSGRNTGETMDATGAMEQIEVVFNYYQSNPGKAYADDRVVVDSLVMSSTGKIWDGRTVASVYDGVKGKLVQHLSRLERSDKGFRMIDLSEPVIDGGITKVYMHLNMGQGEIREAQQLGALQIRWAIAPVGFEDNAPCNGAANEGIGQAVNANLGFFLQNLPPAPLNPGNPNVNPSAVILSPISIVQTNLLGVAFPGGPPPLFVETSTNFPNPINAGNQPPNYAATGQYKIHAELEINGFPDEHCFSLQKFGAYVLSNRQVGDGYVNQVNQILNTNIFNRRRLIATYVGANAPELVNPLGILRIQEHPTYHYYARVLFIAVEAPIALDDM